MTSSSGNISALLAILCEEFIGHRWIPSQRPWTQSFWCFLWSSPEQTVCVNNRDAGDLGRYRAHYDVTVIWNVDANDISTLSAPKLQWNTYVFILMKVSSIAGYTGSCQNDNFQFSSTWWHFCYSVFHGGAQITKALGSTSIRHWSDTFASDRCLTDVNPSVFANWVANALSYYEHKWDIFIAGCTTVIVAVSVKRNNTGLILGL